MLEQGFTVVVLRNEVRRGVTAPVSLFIYISQQDVTHKEIICFKSYTGLLIMSILVTFRFEEITLY